MFAYILIFGVKVRNVKLVSIWMSFCTPHDINFYYYLGSKINSNLTCHSNPGIRIIGSDINLNTVSKGESSSIALILRWISFPHQLSCKLSPSTQVREFEGGPVKKYQKLQLFWQSAFIILYTVKKTICHLESWPPKHYKNQCNHL